MRQRAGPSSEHTLTRDNFTAAALVVLAAGLLSLPWTGHVDDSDAQLYTVVVRNMVADGTWTRLRYLPTVHPEFREHLPFGFWPYALAVRIGGERLLGGVAAQFSLGMVLWMLWGARRLGSAAGGRWGVLLLVLSEAFNTTGGEARLDAPLLFFSTGAAMAALVLPPRFSRGVLVAVLASAGVLVKGPFGLLPLVAAGVTRALLERSWRVVLWVAGVSLVAVLPLTAFLYWDATHLGGTWWRGYGQAQLLASALGRRTDGLQPWWYPFSTLGTRFWPGLPFLGLGGVLLVRRGLSAEHRPALRRLGLTTLLCLLGLCLPARKLWHHALVVFPMAALFGGVAIQAAWARWRRADSWSPVLVSALALAVWTGVVTGAGRVLYRPRCLAAGPFAPALSRLTVGEEILVVSPRPEWAVLSALSAERRLVPVSTRVLPPPLGARASVALIHGVPPAAGSGWRVIGQRGDWALAMRR